MLLGSFRAARGSAPTLDGAVVPVVGPVSGRGATGFVSVTTGLRSSTLAPSSLGVDEQPTSSPATANIVIHLFIVRSFRSGSPCCRLLSLCVRQRLVSGPHAGSRTSPLVSVKRCLTRPSLETAANIPRPLT